MKRKIRMKTNVKIVEATGSFKDSLRDRCIDQLPYSCFSSTLFDSDIHLSKEYCEIHHKLQNQFTQDDRGLKWKTVQ